MAKKAVASKSSRSLVKTPEPGTPMQVAAGAGGSKPASPRPARKKVVDASGHVGRVRVLCLAMPGVFERLSHGEPTFFVRKRVFAMVSNNHHSDGRVAVVVPFEPGLQGMMLRDEPKKYFYPPYVGKAGWLGVHLAKVTDKELAQHLTAAWRLVGPKRLVAEFDGRP